MKNTLGHIDTFQLGSDTAEGYEADEKTLFGFWVYLMTDCILFASLFAVYAVLRGSTAGGPNGHELFNMPYVLAETLLLLTSSFTCGLTLLAAQKRQISSTLLYLAITGAFGLVFLGLELHEFAQLTYDGDSWQRSAFLSAFFTLVGTHGLHITVGVIWASIMGLQIKQYGFTRHTLRRLTLFSLFWHFLDVVWIFIFTIVYLLGALPS